MAIDAVIPSCFLKTLKNEFGINIALSEVTPMHW